MNTNNIFFNPNNNNPQNKIISNTNTFIPSNDVLKHSFNSVCSRLYDIQNENFNYNLEEKLKDVKKDFTNQILELQEEFTINMSDFDYSNDIKDLNDEINNIKKENEELRNMINNLVNRVEDLENNNLENEITTLNF